MLQSSQEDTSTQIHQQQNKKIKVFFNTSTHTTLVLPGEKTFKDVFDLVVQKRHLTITDRHKLIFLKRGMLGSHKLDMSSPLSKYKKENLELIFDPPIKNAERKFFSFFSLKIYLNSQQSIWCQNRSIAGNKNCYWRYSKNTLQLCSISKQVW